MNDSSPTAVLRQLLRDRTGCTPLRQDRYKIIMKCAARGGAPFPLFVKIHQVRGPLASLRDTLGLAGGERSLHIARALADRGIPVPCPYGAVTDRNLFGWSSGSIFATEWMHDMTSLREFTREASRRGAQEQDVFAPLNHSLGRFVALLHNNGVRSKDLNDGNFLIHRPDGGSFQIMLIDYEYTELVRTFKLKWRLGNLAQVTACMLPYVENAPEQVCAGYESAITGFHDVALAREVRSRAVLLRARWKKNLDSRFDQIEAHRTSS